MISLLLTISLLAILPATILHTVIRLMTKSDNHPPIMVSVFFGAIASILVGIILYITLKPNLSIGALSVVFPLGVLVIIFSICFIPIYKKGQLFQPIVHRYKKIMGPGTPQKINKKALMSAVLKSSLVTVGAIFVLAFVITLIRYSNEYGALSASISAFSEAIFVSVISLVAVPAVILFAGIPVHLLYCRLGVVNPVAYVFCSVVFSFFIFSSPELAIASVIAALSFWKYAVKNA